MNNEQYKVYIYEEEASLISKWTLQFPTIETGGDLFGLWLNESEVVIQAVLGPGQNCRRSTTSFFQDAQYLKNTGGLLTIDQGLCNIGSWHSHHTMNIPEPSRGDRQTIWENLPPSGSFLLLITMIDVKTASPKVQLGFNLFELTDRGKKVIPMRLGILREKNPFRQNEDVNIKILEGAERTSKKLSYSEAYVQSALTVPEVNEEWITKRSETVRPNTRRQEVNVRGNHGKQTREMNRCLQSANMTCAGVDHRIIQPYGFSRDRRSSYDLKFYPLSDGRQKVIMYHHGHPIGHYEITRYKVVEHYEESLCCNIL